MVLLAGAVGYSGLHGDQFYGLHGAEAMDAGQLARNLWRGQGYVTQTLRPLEFRYLNSIGRLPAGSQRRTRNPNCGRRDVSAGVVGGVPCADAGISIFPGTCGRWRRTGVMMMVGWVLVPGGDVLLYLLAREMFDHRGGDDERVHVPV